MLPSEAGRTLTQIKAERRHAPWNQSGFFFDLHQLPGLR
jgi:hypothetical protein